MEENYQDQGYQESLEMASEEAPTTPPTTPVPMGQSALERIASLIIIIATFLAPLFFLPVVTSPFYLTKAVVIYIPIIVSLILFVITVIRRGVLPSWHKTICIGGSALGIALIVSAALGLSWAHSLIGYGFEVGSAAFWITMLLLSYVISVLFRSNERVAYLYLSLFAATGLVLLWLIIRLIAGADVLSFGIFNSLVANPIGNWNDVGIILALVVFLASVTLHFLSLSKRSSLVVGIVMYASLLMLVVVNFPLLWKLLAVAMIAFIYLAKRKKKEVLVNEENSELPAPAPKRKISVHSLIILVVALVFAFMPANFTNRVPTALGISYLEVRPAWTSTANIYVEAIKENPLSGVGENNFFSIWSAHKPDRINLTNFWSVDFNYAVGLVPTLAITTGLLGSIALLLFFGALIKMAIKTWRFRSDDPLAEYLVASSFLGALLLWLVNIFYVPTFAPVFLSFVFLGLWLAMIYNKDIMPAMEIQLARSKFLNLLSIVILVAFVILSIVFGYTLVQKYRASLAMQKGAELLNETADIGQAETQVLKAISLDPQDVYYRSLSELILLRLNTVVSLNGGRVTDDIAQGVQELINATIGSANEAIALRPNDYNNHLFLARIYGSFVSGGLPGAYEKAREVYDRTIAINPTNPGIYLESARLELSHNDAEKARNEITKAIEVKPNYTDAIFLLSQIEVAEGNVPQAIRSVEAAITTAPNNPLLYFQLGLLHYNQNNFENAKAVFEQAVALVPDYANAKYFLGLTYYRAGETMAAIAQFEDLKVSNPDNTEVDLILGNLKAGSPPFEGAAPPIDDEPEARENPPIDESLEVDDVR